MSDTRTRLLDGALETLRTKGIARVSARTIAAAAGVNQALVFCHFGSVDELLAAACTYGAQQRLASYASRLDAVRSLSDLLAVGLELHRQERAHGNVIVLAQMLAGAQSEPRLGPATAQALELWISGIEAVLRRVLAGLAACRDPRSRRAGEVDRVGVHRVRALRRRGSGGRRPGHGRHRAARRAGRRHGGPRASGPPRGQGQAAALGLQREPAPADKR